MEYAYATSILNESGEEINERNLTAVLEAAGCHVQESRVKAIVAALEDIDIENVTDVDSRTAAIDARENGDPVDADINVTERADGAPQERDEASDEANDEWAFDAIDEPPETESTEE